MLRVEKLLKVLTIKILLDTDFTSYLAHFLHNIVGAQLNIGGAQALPKGYKVTPMLGSVNSDMDGPAWFDGS